MDQPAPWGNCLAAAISSTFKPSEPDTILIERQLREDTGHDRLCVSRMVSLDLLNDPDRSPICDRMGRAEGQEATVNETRTGHEDWAIVGDDWRHR
ncbi:uncharacterized protein ATNIH1004_009565 [Aspergillus tanneri]|uniref:Uncharacterized protein n=1 Tax=Aspergillus tanneri TaxID=1220188 RepID=A0A5M9MCZ3_9EURO|nr:uncharacterized protein ATNIH1004_009565 [Aspergillus tanneri]KAA8642813.1 hypothetical protein ATNIH1004_009565 [Aspergillus tanneri]